MRRRVEEGATFYLVVPAHRSPEAAGKHLAEALARFRAVGANFDGCVGDPHPMAAVHDALHGRKVDEIVICTLPAGISRLVESDVPSKIARVFASPSPM